VRPDPAKLWDFAARYTAAWCSQDAASVAQFFSPDGSLTINNEVPYDGRSAIAEIVQSFMTTFPNLQLLMDDVFITDNGAEYQWTLVGTNTGPEGTGNPVRISGVELWQFGPDGLIAESQGHFDSADYNRQLEELDPASD
jgi:uncharacterized protein (TIGR02246 family)